MFQGKNRAKMVDVLKIQTSLLSKSWVEKCNRMFEDVFFLGGEERKLQEMKK